MEGKPIVAVELKVNEAAPWVKRVKEWPQPHWQGTLCPPVPIASVRAALCSYRRSRATAAAVTDICEFVSFVASQPHKPQAPVEVLFSRGAHLYLYISPERAFAVRCPRNLRVVLSQRHARFATVFGHSSDPSSDINLSQTDRCALADPSLDFPGCVRWKLLDDKPELTDQARKCIAGLRDVLIFEGPNEVQHLLQILATKETCLAVGLGDAEILASFPFKEGELHVGTLALSNDDRPSVVIQAFLLPLTTHKLIQSLSGLSWSTVNAPVSDLAWENSALPPSALTAVLNELSSLCPAVALQVRRLLLVPQNTGTVVLHNVASQPTAVPSRRTKKPSTLVLPPQTIEEALHSLPSTEKAAIILQGANRPCLVLFVGSFRFDPMKAYVDIERLAVLPALESHAGALVVSAETLTIHGEGLLKSRRKLLRTLFWFSQSNRLLRALEVAETENAFRLDVFTSPVEICNQLRASVRIALTKHATPNAAVDGELALPLYTPLFTRLKLPKHVFFAALDAPVADLLSAVVEDSSRQILLGVGARSLTAALKKADLKERAWIDSATAKLQRLWTQMKDDARWPAALRQFTSSVSAAAPHMSVQAIVVLPIWLIDVFAQEDRQLTRYSSASSDEQFAGLWSVSDLDLLTRLMSTHNAAFEVYAVLEELCQMQSVYFARDLEAHLAAAANAFGGTSNNCQSITGSRLTVSITTMDLLRALYSGLPCLEQNFQPLLFAWDPALKSFCEAC